MRVKTSMIYFLVLLIFIALIVNYQTIIKQVKKRSGSAIEKEFFVNKKSRVILFTPGLIPEYQYLSNMKIEPYFLETTKNNYLLFHYQIFDLHGKRLQKPKNMNVRCYNFNKIQQREASLEELLKIDEFGAFEFNRIALGDDGTKRMNSIIFKLDDRYEELFLTFDIKMHDQISFEFKNIPNLLD